MKSLVRLAALFLALAASAAANANSFTFTYTTSSYSLYDGSPYYYNGPVKVTGSFDGDANGKLITNLSNIALSINGVPFVSSSGLFSSLETSTGTLGFTGVVSRDATERNFNFTDGKNFFFLMKNTTSFNYDPPAYTAAVNIYGQNLYSNDTSGISARWTLTEVSAVPEPATYAMLVAGLGLIGFAARRRRNTGATALAA